MAIATAIACILIGYLHWLPPLNPRPFAGKLAFDVSGSALKPRCSSYVLSNFKFPRIDGHARKYAMKAEI
jgi:hypothetical protein